MTEKDQRMGVRIKREFGYGRLFWLHLTLGVMRQWCNAYPLGESRDDGVMSETEFGLSISPFFFDDFVWVLRGLCFAFPSA